MKFEFYVEGAIVESGLARSRQNLIQSPPRSTLHPKTDSSPGMRPRRMPSQLDGPSHMLFSYTSCLVASLSGVDQAGHVIKQGLGVGSVTLPGRTGQF